jgi:hypothetical protein
VLSAVLIGDQLHELEAVDHEEHAGAPCYHCAITAPPARP